MKFWKTHYEGYMICRITFINYLFQNFSFIYNLRRPREYLFLNIKPLKVKNMYHFDSNLFLILLIVAYIIKCMKIQFDLVILTSIYLSKWTRPNFFFYHILTVHFALWQY